MAIKKGAFEQYTKERQLPSKQKISVAKTTHFFDEVDDVFNASQSVHNRLTENGDSIDASLTPPGADSNLSNGSQMVHNQFTEKTDAIDANLIPLSKKAMTGNSPQSVHNRFTDNGDSIGTSLIPPGVDASLNNGTQRVHDWPTNGSHADGRKPRQLFSKLKWLVGNQRKIIFALYKNTRTNNTATTEELTLDMISVLSGVNKQSLKNTLFRLKDKGYIRLVDQKVGRCGWVKYQIDSELVNDLMNFL